MRSRRRRWIGYTSIAVGILILMTFVMPCEFWWFALAASLIASGLWWLRCCC